MINETSKKETYIMVKKVGMTQVYRGEGKRAPVTLVFLEKGELEFEEGQKIVITGVSKGKGFQGAMKRHGFHGAPASHGHKHDLRRVGSIGSGFPERVVKGRRMPGHMGQKTTTIKNVEVVRIDKENRLAALKGALPGAVGSTIKIRQ